MTEPNAAAPAADAAAAPSSRRPAGMEPRRPLCRHGRAGAEARPRARREPSRSPSRTRYKGKLAEIAGGAEAARALAEAVVAFEALEELLGRIVSFAGLLHAGDTSDPDALQVLRRRPGEDHRRRARICSSSRSNSTASTTPCSRRRWRDPALGHYRPWIEDVRKEKPYQLEDRVEQLFHEKSVTGRGAWNRLFDETMAALRFTVDGEELAHRADAEPAAGRRRGEAQGGGRGAGRRPSRTNIRLFTHITNTLAKDKEISDRWRGFKDVADARHLVQPRRAARWSRRWSRRCAPPIRACRTATTR